MRPVALFVSILFHPLLLTTYLVLLIGLFFPQMLMIPSQHFRVVLLFVFCFTFVLPVINLMMLRVFGAISSYSLRSRKERLIPFIGISVIYVALTFLFLYRLPFSINFIKLIAIVTMLVVASTIFTFFMKVSIHSLAMWGGVGILLPLNKAMEDTTLLWPTAGVIVIAGVVMTARLYLQAHTPREVLYGSISGFIIGFASMLIMF